MNLNERERIIREKKTAEARSKDLMGISGKPGTIMRMLGQPIFQHYEGFELYGDNQWDDYIGTSGDGYIPNYYELTPDERFPTLGNSTSHDHPTSYGWGDGPSKVNRDMIGMLGYSFDGLSRGMHLSMKFMEDDHQLEISWQGYPVFEERGGELFRYVNGEWEDKIENLYNLAKKKLESHNIEVKEVKKLEVLESKLSWLDKMKTFWGI